MDIKVNRFATGARFYMHAHIYAPILHLFVLGNLISLAASTWHK
jgi:uncharacterized membrane protein